MSSTRLRLSVVIPVFNESESVEALVQALAQALEGRLEPFEVILVDDGSRDATAVKLTSLEQKHAWLKPLYLVRNYGQSTALQAGFDQAQGEFIVTLDGDLQNDPEDIAMMVERLEADPTVDMISGWRKDRQDAK